MIFDLRHQFFYLTKLGGERSRLLQVGYEEHAADAGLAALTILAHINANNRISAFAAMPAPRFAPMPGMVPVLFN